jgi:hypothetical protein
VKLELQAMLAIGHADQTLVHVRLLDLSCAGAGMLLPCDLPQGTRLVLLLPTPEGIPMTVCGHVVNSHAMKGGQFRIGTAFDVNHGFAIERIRAAFFPD